MFKFIIKKIKIVILQIYILKLASHNITNKSYGHLKINGLICNTINNAKQYICFQIVVLFSLLCFIILKFPLYYTISLPISIFIFGVYILYTTTLFTTINNATNDIGVFKNSYVNMRNQTVYYMLALFNHDYVKYNKYLELAMLELKTYYPTINNKQYLQILKDIEIYSIEIK